MSLLDAAERLASISRSQIVLDKKHCLYSQDQYSECAACFQICPVGAICVGKPPSLNAELCQSCLACIPACPVGAYSADDDVANLLNCATRVDDLSVELLCGLHPQPETGCDKESIGIQILGCLAGLGSGAYLTLSTLGRTRIISRTDACQACKWQIHRSKIHQQVEKANRFLDAWGKNNTINCSDEIPFPVQRVLWDAKNPPLSRRDLFRMMARQGQVALARAMENRVTSSTRQPGRDRLRLLSAVTHLPDPSASAVDPGGGVDLSDFGFASVTISASCTACGTCAKACPTEALHFTKDEEEMTFSISFSVQKCIGCNLCEHVCQPDAISIDHAPTFEQVFGMKEPVIAAAGSMVRCGNCKTFMAAREGVKLCLVCEYRRTHPFGSMLPKKVVKETRS